MKTLLPPQSQRPEALHISGNHFTVYDSVSATCCVSTPVHMYVTLDSSILWLPAQVHPIAAGNEPSHWCQTGQQGTKKMAQIQDEACFDPHHLHLAVTAAPQVRLCHVEAEAVHKSHMSAHCWMCFIHKWCLLPLSYQRSVQLNAGTTPEEFLLC